jgi:hypothetical protein
MDWVTLRRKELRALRNVPSLTQPFTKQSVTLRLTETQRIEDALGSDLFIAGPTKRRDEVDRLVSGLASTHASGSVDQAATLVGLWPDMTVTERRDVLAGAVDAVMVRRGRLPVNDRAVVPGVASCPTPFPSAAVASR